VSFNIRLRDAKADARHAEEVATEREKLREKRAAKEARRKQGPSIPKGYINLNTLGMSVMMHVSPGAQADLDVPLGNSLHDMVSNATEPIIYVNKDEAYVVLTPPEATYELGATIRLVIVRGPRPFRRALAEVTLQEYARSSEVVLPRDDDWVVSDDPDVIYSYTASLLRTRPLVRATDSRRTLSRNYLERRMRES
jgi:hypothetical protein